MQIEVTDTPNPDDEAFVIAQTRAYNAAFATKDIRSLCVFVRDEAGRMMGGLTAKTYWNYLDISFLWVAQAHRHTGLASKLMHAAEREALARGCQHAVVDTYSFQARGFYEKSGYQEFGRLSGYSGKHDRHYFHKALQVEPT
jgi:GNAT superfamily N-acetyltransferase